MIRINNVEYEDIYFKYESVAGEENLHIYFYGQLDSNKNKLHIDYKGNSYFGCKVVLNTCNNITEIIVYIYQKGDSELC